MDPSHPSLGPSSIQGVSPSPNDNKKHSINQDKGLELSFQAAAAIPTPAITTGDDQYPNSSVPTLNTKIHVDTDALSDEKGLRYAPEVDLSKTSTARKLLLLAMFTLAEFLDAFNNSALFPAIPIISEQLNFDAFETVWIVSAYQLTFAAFLLVSGRISDG